jgi:hypothetical protein
LIFEFKAELKTRNSKLKTHKEERGIRDEQGKV